MKINWPATVLSLACGFFGAAAHGLTAEVHTLNAAKGAALLFTYERLTTPRTDGGREETGVFKDPEGNIAVEEKVKLDSSGKLISYELNQRQIGNNGRIEIRGGKAHFSFEKDGKIKTADEDAVADLVVGPTLVPYLQKNWATLKKGESINARLAVTDRRETVGFKFALAGDGKEGDVKTARVKMSASSMLISALVSPLYFNFTDDGEKLLSFEGRTLLKRKVDGAWRDLDARTVYKD